jgi:hypothetical protein
VFLGAHGVYGQAGLRRQWIVRLHKILHTLNWSAADTASAQNDLIKDLIKQGKLLVDGNHQ